VVHSEGSSDKESDHRVQGRNDMELKAGVHMDIEEGRPVELPKTLEELRKKI